LFILKCDDFDESSSQVFFWHFASTELSLGTLTSLLLKDYPVYSYYFTLD